MYSKLLFVGLYSEPIVNVFFKFLHEKAAASNSVVVLMSTSTASMLDLAIMAVPPWALPGQSFLAKSGNCQAVLHSFISGLSHVSEAMIISGSVYSSMPQNSSRLAFILWKFIFNSLKLFLLTGHLFCLVGYEVH